MSARGCFASHHDLNYVSLEDVTKDILSLLDKPLPPGKARWIVGLTGIAASGKTTSAQILCDMVNNAHRVLVQQNNTQGQRHQQSLQSAYVPFKHKENALDDVKRDDGSSPASYFQPKSSNESSSYSSSSPSLPPSVCTIMPMDGYHLTRAQLDAMPNAAEAHARRGAHWTFDVEGLGHVVKRVASCSDDVAVHGWDHSIKDPSWDAITIKAHHKIVILEGFYVLLELGKWPSLVGKHVDRRYLVQCSKEESLRRGSVRNWKAGICPTLEASIHRWKVNDEANGVLMLENLDYDRLDGVLSQREVERCTGNAAAAGGEGIRTLFQVDTLRSRL